jgi:hypothetical protein
MKNAPHTHSVIPVAVKPSMSVALPLLATDSRVRLATGNTQSALRKIIANEKMTKSTLRSKQAPRQPVDSQTLPGRSFFTFEALPAFKSEISLLPNLIEKSPPKYSQQHARSIQTDIFYERPESPPYIPPKVGNDEGTQITDVTELFDFDVECMPLVDTIVSKSISQAIFEVQAEEELRVIQATYELLSLRQREDQKDTESRQSEFISSHSSKRAYIDDIKQTKAYERTLRTIVASKKLMADILPALVDNVVKDLLREGLLKDPTDSAIRENIMPSVLDGVSKKTAALELSSNLVDGTFSFSQFILKNYRKFPELYFI